MKLLNKMFLKLLGFFYYKPRVLWAMSKLRFKYLNPRGEIFFVIINCPLCKIYFKDKCGNCPVGGNYKACYRFLTFQLAIEDYNKDFLKIHSGEYVPDSFYNRSEFYERAIKVVKRYPAEIFVPGSEFDKKLVEELDKIDMEISQK